MDLLTSNISVIDICRVYIHKVIDISRCRHNSEGLCKNFTYSKSINKGIDATSKGSHANLVRNSSFLYLSILVKNLRKI